jgi:hypothetical protein
MPLPATVIISGLNEAGLAAEPMSYAEEAEEEQARVLLAVDAVLARLLSHVQPIVEPVLVDAVLTEVTRREHMGSAGKCLVSSIL